MSITDAKEKRLNAIKESLTYGKAHYARMCEELDLHKKDLEKLNHNVEEIKRKIVENRNKGVPDILEHSRLQQRLSRRITEIETVQSSIETSSTTIESVKNRIQELEFEKDVLEKEIAKWGTLYEFKVNGR